MDNPFEKFSQWLADAVAHPAISEPTAMTLATIGEEGAPNARTVLLKQHSQQGFTFYTNFTSRKGMDLQKNNQASLCFYWMPLDRQVVINGTATPVTDAVADAYYASRPRARQLAAWASLQSQPLESREALEARMVAMEKKFVGADVPRPPHWSGWCLAPRRIEFLELSSVRLHAREVYTRIADTEWQYGLLYP
jgi:pyridoxamine 5'-phosphate oxidase